jgi:hypothetical protein
MKKFNLSKELLLNGILIGALSIGLVSCGGGGGGGSGPSTPTSPTGSGPSTPLSYSLATYLYSGTDYYNEPIITVYIDGQPVKLLADTGDSGLIVNSSAVNIPSSDLDISYSFLDSFGDGSLLSGIMASATVCINPSITNSCVVMPIAVLTSNGFLSGTGEAQGDFGLASGYDSMDVGNDFISGYSLTGYSYPYYLEMQYGINSYNISFYSLTNGYYSNVSSTTPIGQISFGAYNGNSNTLIPYTMDSFGDPSTTVVFSSSTTSFTSDAVFDSGNSYNALSTSVFQTEIPNFFQNTSYENACANYDGFQAGIVNGGFVISYSLQNNSGSFYSGTFTTEPSSSFCSETGNPFSLMEGITLDNGPEPFGDIFGLSAMLGHTFTWVLGTSGTNQGFVQGISINP